MNTLLFWYKQICAFIRKTGQDDVAAYSGQSALFILISFFPFVMFLLTLIQYLPFDENDLRSLIPEAFPDMVQNLYQTIVTELYHNSGGALLSLTVVTGIWSASRGFLAVIRGLNSVYGIRESRSYLKLRALAALYTLAFALILLLTLTLLVFGNTLYQWCIRHFPWSTQTLFFLMGGRTLLTALTLTAFFWLLYLVVPNRRTKVLSELPGAIFAACGWLLFSFGYSYYMEHISNVLSMYGSLTAIVLLVLWLYFCMYILFLGAEINQALHGWQSINKET